MIESNLEEEVWTRTFAEAWPKAWPCWSSMQIWFVWDSLLQRRFEIVWVNIDMRNSSLPWGVHFWGRKYRLVFDHIFNFLHFDFFPFPKGWRSSIWLKIYPCLQWRTLFRMYQQRRGKTCLKWVGCPKMHSWWSSFHSCFRLEFTWLTLSLSYIFLRVIEFGGWWGGLWWCQWP